MPLNPHHTMCCFMPHVPHINHNVDPYYINRHRAQCVPQAMALLASPAQGTASNTGSKAKKQWPRDANPTEGTHSPPSHHHPYKRSGASANHSFRPNSSETSQTVCVVCLRRPHPNMGECREETLSDGDPAFSTRNKLGQLTDRQGKSLCADFQHPKGCFSKRHSARHRCAGCGSEQHGASECSRRPTN